MRVLDWKDSNEIDPIIYTSATGRRGVYYMSRVSSGFCINMDMPGGGNAFIGNGKNLDECKDIAESFDSDLSQKLYPG